MRLHTASSVKGVIDCPSSVVLSSIIGANSTLARECARARTRDSMRSSGAPDAFTRTLCALPRDGRNPLTRCATDARMASMSVLPERVHSGARGLQGDGSDDGEVGSNGFSIARAATCDQQHHAIRLAHTRAYAGGQCATTSCHKDAIKRDHGIALIAGGDASCTCGNDVETTTIISSSYARRIRRIPEVV